VKELFGRPSVSSDDLVQSVDLIICERWRFKISELSCEFPHISPTVPYAIITVREAITSFAQDGFRKCSRVLKKTQRVASAMIVLEQYHKDGDEFLSHTVRVTVDETWVSFLNAGTKEQSKQ
jgi:hypothetical protein